MVGCQTPGAEDLEKLLKMGMVEMFWVLSSGQWNMSKNDGKHFQTFQKSPMYSSQLLAEWR